MSIWETPGRESTETFLTFLTRLMILVGIPVVGLSLLSARQVMILFSTPDYVQGALSFPWWLPGVSCWGWQWIAQRGMILANKTVRIMVLYSVAGLSNIIANLLLVPKMGYIGPLGPPSRVTCFCCC